MINTVRKDIWINSYPIFLWLALEPIVGLIDSKIASVINLDTLSAIGIGIVSGPNGLIIVQIFA